MTYLLSTCRKSTAVLGSVYGNFDGSGEFHHLVLNCVNRLEIWEVNVAEAEKIGLAHQQHVGPSSSSAAGEGGGGANLLAGSGLYPHAHPFNNVATLAANSTHNDEYGIGGGAAAGDRSHLAPPPMRLVAEYPMNATIKHLLAVPLPVARTTRHPRLCLFITTEKLDVCIIALNRSASSAAPQQHAGPSSAHATAAAATATTPCAADIIPETLYSTNIASSLFHRHFGQASLCVSSHPDTSLNTAPSAASGKKMDGGSSSGSDSDNVLGDSVAATPILQQQHGGVGGDGDDNISAAAAATTASVYGEDDIAPVVALSHIRNYIILFDIAACIVDGAAMACNKRMQKIIGSSNGGGVGDANPRKRGRNGQQAAVTVINNSQHDQQQQQISSLRNSGALSEDDGVAQNVDVISQSTATTAITLGHHQQGGNSSRANDDDAAPPAMTPLPSTSANATTNANNGEATATTGGGAVGDNQNDDGKSLLSDEPTDAELSQQLQSTRLFSIAFIGSSLLKKRVCLPFSYCPIMEAEPRSICLQRSAVYGKSLVVLNQDPLGRTHVRRYTVAEQPMNSNNNNMNSSNGGGGPSGFVDVISCGHTMLQQRQMPILAPVFDRSVLRLVSKSTGLVLTRGMMLQNDVETDAMLLHPMPKGVLVIGSVLATYVDTEGRNAKGHVTTTITPNPFARSEPVSVQNLSPVSCVAGYVNGAMIVYALEDGERGELFSYTLAPETTPMTSLATIGGGFFFASSAYHHSMLVHKSSGYCVPAIANTGPIVEMTVIDTNASTNSSGSSTTNPAMPKGTHNNTGGMAVVAATGVEHFTSLQVIREAIQLNEEATVEGLPGVLSLHSVPAIGPDSAPINHYSSNRSDNAPCFGLLAISFATETRMMLFEEDHSNGGLSLEEAEFTCNEPTLCLGRIAPSAVVHATPSGLSLLHVSATAVRSSGTAIQFPRRANMAVTDPQCSTLLAVSGNEVSIYELPSLQLLHTIVFPHQVASIDMTAAYEVVVGLWDANAIQVFSAEDLTPFTLVEGLPMLPRSVRLSSLVRSRFMTDASATADRAALTERHLFVGFTDGSIGMIPITHSNDNNNANDSSSSAVIVPVNRNTSIVGRLEHLALGSQPVSVIPILNSNKITSGILCTGDVPGALFASNARGIDSSGFGVRPIDSAAQITATTFATYVASEGKLIISSLDAKISHRVNAIGTPVRQTIPKIKLIPRWNNILLAAQREPLQDTIVSYYVAGGTVNKSTRVTSPLILLESERCEFIEYVELNGAPFTVAEGEVPVTSAPSSGNPFNSNSFGGNNNQNGTSANNNNNSPFLTRGGTWDPSAPFSAALIGTNFAYPNDDIPRNGRIMLVGMERGTNNKLSMVQLCDRDIRGMVMCACMVPRTSNRILVGVTGCVQMYRWSPSDRSFVFEISASFGAAVTKLIPLSGSSLGAMKARPQPPQIVAATPMVRAAGTRPNSQTSHRTLGGFSSVTNNTGVGVVARSNPASPNTPTNPQDGDDVLEDRETSSLVLCADMRNSLAVIALNPVELMRVEANERAFREVLDVIPAGNRAFIEKKTGLKVYDPHFITSDTDLNLFIISAMKEKKPSMEGGSVYQLKGVVPQLTVCGQIHVGDRITVLQRGSLQVTKKIKSSSAASSTTTITKRGGVVMSSGSTNGAGRSTLDAASAAAAAAGNALGRLVSPFAEAGRKASTSAALLPDVTERFAHPSSTSAAGADTTIISRGIRDAALPSFIYGTVHGAMGAITPLNPLAFNYLVLLQRCLVKAIKPVGGLSYDQFKKVFNRETSVAMTSTPHFVEARDGDDTAHKKSLKHKAYNFVDGDLLFQFLAPSTPSASYGLDEPSKAHAVHMANKTIRSAAFSGDLFRGTDIDSKKLGVGGGASAASIGNNNTNAVATAGGAALSTNGAVGAAASSAAVAGGRPAAAASPVNALITPTAAVVPSFTAAQTQAPPSIPATPMVNPRQQQGLVLPTNTAASQGITTDANGNSYDAEGNKITPDTLLTTAAPRRTTFTPSEMEHLNELFAIAELPEYPLTVESCERFLSDLRRFC